MRLIGFCSMIATLLVAGNFCVQQCSHAEEVETGEDWLATAREKFRLLRDRTYSYRSWKDLLQETRTEVEKRMAVADDDDPFLQSAVMYLLYLEGEEKLYDLTRQMTLKYYKNPIRLPRISIPRFLFGSEVVPNAVWEAYIHLLVDPSEDWEVRRAIFTSIGYAYGGCHHMPLREGSAEIRKRLKVFCSEEYPEETAATAAIRLWELGEKSEQLIPYIRHGLGTNWDYMAVRILAEDVRDQTMLPFLFDYATRQLPYERKMAAICIGKVASSDDQKALELLLSLTNDGDYGVRQAAYHGLAYLANRTVVPFVIEQLTNKDIPACVVQNCFVTLSGYVCEQYYLRYSNYGLSNANIDERRTYQAKVMKWWESNKEKSTLDILKEAMARKDLAQANKIYLVNLITHAENLLDRRLFPERWWKNPSPFCWRKKHEIILEILEKHGDKLSWNKQRKCYSTEVGAEQK